MSESAEQRLNEILAEYRRKRDGVLQMQRQLSSTAATVKSRDRMISVTVDALGTVTALKFESKDYQSMEPAELAALVLDTMQKARDKVRADAKQIMDPFLPRGTAFEDLSSGKLDLARLLPEKPRSPEEVHQLLTMRDAEDGEPDHP
ncbi:YbaB/EbfC family nucleoid-associated protein [Kitasatospora azatica]|uniref:YbaB/EbfC family nucleoid-associated protein n=1 Tax=Kitasatospora azatica TaxID=58347 RepID=UPI00056CCA45|nr:YbaB/EbfC family nucleoid-associated protein [Kitasatospora azatica]